MWSIYDKEDPELSGVYWLSSCKRSADITFEGYMKRWQHSCDAALVIFKTRNLCG